MMNCKALLPGAALVLACVAGCGSSDPDVDPIDLNKVLDIMVGILEKPADPAAAAKPAPAGEAE